MFTSCKSLSSIEIPTNITSIGTSAFMSSGLASIAIPNSVSRLYGGCFSFCNNLSEICIPSSVSQIDLGVLRGCENLRTVIIEGNPYIDDLNFSWCENLADIYCYSIEVPTYLGVFLNSPAESMTLHVPVSAIDKYKSTKPWNTIGNIVPLTDDDPHTTRIQTHKNADVNSKVYYDLYGRQNHQLRRGLNIKHMSNGSIKKVLVK